MTALTTLNATNLAISFLYRGSVTASAGARQFAPLPGHVPVPANTGALLESGVPLLSAIALAKGVIVNRILAAGIDDVAQNLHRGGRMAAALRVSAGLPIRAVQLIEVGEVSGKLPRMLEKVAEIYDQEVETTLKRLLSILEPALILGLGGLIAVIIISILVAILGLNELVV